MASEDVACFAQYTWVLLKMIEVCWRGLCFVEDACGLLKMIEVC